MRSLFGRPLPLSSSWKVDQALLCSTLFVAGLAAIALVAGSIQRTNEPSLALTDSQAQRFAKILFDAKPEEPPEWLRAHLTSPRPYAAKETTSTWSIQQRHRILDLAEKQSASAVLGILGTTPGGGGGLSGGGGLGMNGSARLGVLGGSSGNPLLARSAARSAGIMGPLHREPVFPLLPDSSRYHHPKDHGITEVAKQPVSTFALDVDTGSYSNVRSYLRSGLLPPKDAVRLEEFVNYFPYEYPPPVSPHPFGVVTEVARCPWNPAHSLLRIGVRAADITPAALPSANLVFLIDVSGSMQSEERLPLLQQSLRFLVEQLRPQDQISIVVYAGSEAVLLPPTSAAHKQRILSVIDSLQAGGSTAGHSGIRAAYELARQSFIPSGTNRILLATDGDFNVGVSDTEELVALVERERKSGVSLSTLGFGFGNVNDHMMERLADAGNGSYSFIDSLREGRKVLLTQAYSTLHTVAKDVKIQVEFNPAQIREYRLLGYENRILNREDFQNDHVDAGEIGAGATATALYELTPIEAKPSFEPLRYAMATAHAAAPGSSKELGFIRVRYKSPNGGSSKLLELPVAQDVPVRPFLSASYDLRFAASVAGFAQLLRNSPNLGSFSWDDVLRIARNAKGQDEHGYRREFLWMVQTAASLNTRNNLEDRKDREDREDP